MPDYLVDDEAFNMLLEKLEKNLAIYGEESKAVQPFTKNEVELEISDFESEKYLCDETVSIIKNEIYERVRKGRSDDKK